MKNVTVRETTGAKLLKVPMATAYPTNNEIEILTIPCRVPKGFGKAIRSNMLTGQSATDKAFGVWSMPLSYLVEDYVLANHVMLCNDYNSLTAALDNQIAAQLGALKALEGYSGMEAVIAGIQSKIDALEVEKRAILASNGSLSTRDREIRIIMERKKKEVGADFDTEDEFLRLATRLWENKNKTTTTTVVAADSGVSVPIIDTLEDTEDDTDTEEEDITL